MSNNQPPEKQGPRIRWAGDKSDDIEANFRPRGPRRSNSDASIGSNTSRRGSIDPSNALPIQYRTVSIQIEESRDNSLREALKVKDATAIGMITPRSFPIVQKLTTARIGGSRLAHHHTQ